MKTYQGVGRYFCLVPGCDHVGEARGESFRQPSTPDYPAESDFAAFDEPEPCPEHGHGEMYLDAVVDEVTPQLPYCGDPRCGICRERGLIPEGRTS